MPKESDPTNVVYPPQCDGACRLSEFTLYLVGGVLLKNCPGPKGLLLEKPSALAPVFSDGDADIKKDQGDLACNNPRVAKIARARILGKWVGV